MTDHEAGRAHSVQADVGYGVETPARRRFKLDLIPGSTERYFLLCNEASVESENVQQMLALLCGTTFKAAVDPPRQTSGLMTVDRAPCVGFNVR